MMEWEYLLVFHYWYDRDARGAPDGSKQVRIRAAYGELEGRIEMARYDVEKSVGSDSKAVLQQVMRM